MESKRFTKVNKKNWRVFINKFCQEQEEVQETEVESLVSLVAAKSESGETFSGKVEVMETKLSRY